MPKKSPPRKEASKEDLADKYANVKQEDLKEVGSLSFECVSSKEEYDNCFTKWYKNEFLAGKSKPDMVPCQKLFKVYQACVQKAMQRIEGIPEDKGACPIN